MRRGKSLTVLAAAASLALLPAIAVASVPVDVSASINGGETFTNDPVIAVDVLARHCGGQGDNLWKMGDMSVRASDADDITNDTEAVTLLGVWSDEDGDPGCALGEAKSNSFEWTLPGADGTKTIHVRFSHGGHLHASASDSIVLDTTKPSVLITAPADGADTADESVTVIGTASDALSGLKSVTVSNGTTDYSTTLDTPVVGSWTTGEGAVALACGANTLTATAEDNAGNTESHQVSVTRDCSTVPPGGNGSEDWKDAPAVANAALKAGGYSCTHLGKGNSWHGKVISQIAHWAEGVDKSDAVAYPDESAWETAVKVQVDVICS